MLDESLAAWRDNLFENWLLTFGFGVTPLLSYRFMDVIPFHD
jgi:hypothetical protein